MSYTTLHLVKHGGLEDFQEYKNSHGGAMFVWNALANKYLKESAFKFMFGDSAPLWAIAYDSKVSKTDRIVMATTFDRAMVRAENLLDLADRFDEFCKTYPAGNMACSLSQQSADFRKIAEDKEVLGVCWTQTSVAGDVWQVNEEDGESMRSYDIDRDSGHFFVYDNVKVMKD